MNYREESPFDELTELTIDANGRFFLAEAARWARFLAILGFVFLGLGVITSLFMLAGAGTGIAMSGGGFLPGQGLMLGVFYLVILAIYFFPIYFLYQFGTNTRRALDDNNQPALTEALRFLRSHYRFLGIAAIVVLALYGLMILGVLFMAF